MFPSKKNTNLYWYIIFSCTFLFEFFLFRTYIFREVVEFYPPNYDQLSYLNSAYDLYEKILKQGIIPALRDMAYQANTILFSIQGALLFLLLGASRWNALLLNFIYFIALQLVVIKVTKDLTNNYAIATIFIGLILSTISPFFWAGGITDFRIDFIAFCLYGIFVSCALRSYLFLDRKWSFITALIAFFLILMRIITVNYLIPIIFITTTYFLILLYKATKQKIDTTALKRRLKNIFFFASIFGLIIILILWFKRHNIYHYYVVGIFTGSEKHIRALEFGVSGLIQHLLYYPRSILNDHLGNLVIFLSGILLLFPQLFRLLERSTSSINNNLLKDNSITFYDGYFFLAICIFSPLLLPTLGISKSPIIGGIVVIPCLWVVIWSFIYFIQHLELEKLKRTFIILALACLLCGFYNWLQKLGQHSGLYYKNEVPQINKMYEDIGNYFQTKNNTPIYFAADRLTDYYYAGLPFSILYYEKKGKLLNVQATKLASSIFSITHKDALDSLKKSDVFIINLDQYQGKSVYPFDQDMELIRPILKQMAEKEFITLGDYYFMDARHQVYVRPDFTILGDSAGWVTSNGLLLKFQSLQDRRISPKEIILSGKANFNWIPPKLKVFATAEYQNGKKKPLPASIIISGQNYEIHCQLPKEKIINENLLQISIKFSHYFIPKELGINDDERKLIFYTPVTKKIILK